MNHILFQGSALCGRIGLPKDWPEGEKWVYADDLEHATCEGCKMAIGLLDQVIVGGHAVAPYSEDQLLTAGAGMMEVTAVELEPVTRQRHVDQPRERTLEVQVRGMPATPATPATRVTFVRRLMLFCRANKAHMERFDLATDGVRVIFTIDPAHVAALFEVIKL